MERTPILIDTREKKPWNFWGYPTRKAKLDAGDYALLGYAPLAAVERKSVSDFAQCISSWTRRFDRQLDRLAALRFSLMVIEGLPDEIEIVTDKRVSLDSVCGAAATIISRGVNVYFAPRRHSAARMCYHFLRAVSGRIDAES